MVQQEPPPVPKQPLINPEATSEKKQEPKPVAIAEKKIDPPKPKPKPVELETVEKDTLTTIFELLDKDKNGTLEKREILKGLRNIKIVNAIQNRLIFF